MGRWSFLVVCLCFVLSGMAGGAPQNAPDALRQDIETARKKVYPALVNIAVVTRYYVEGRAQRAPAGGSGVIVTADGLVLTNYHVAGNSTRITCTLPSGEEIDARVVMHDPYTDLSVLRLRLDKRANPKAPLAFATLGNSDALQVGDYVLAMGNPLLLSSSMTLGIVSNTKRVFTDFTGTNIEEMTLDEGERTGLFTRWIQHDALILPGNSGGPLVNLKGEVVGINELGGSGIGFAIPAAIAAQALKAAQKGGKLERGWLGISLLPVKKIGRETGALIAAVWPGSPAEKARLAPGDILLSLEDQGVSARFVEEIPPLYQAIAALPVGKPVKMKLLRKGQEKTVTATIALLESAGGKQEEHRDMGVTAREITQAFALAARFPNKDGALVSSVRPGYPFETAQPPILTGDVILKIGEKPTPNLEAFSKALAEVEAQFVVTLRRDKEQILTVVKPKQDKQSSAGTELPKAWIGVKTQVLTPEVAKALKIPTAKGFRITQVYKHTEASKAGLLPGDIITAVNNDKLTASRPQDSEDLKRLVEDLTLGEKAALTVLRGGMPHKVSVLLEAAPTDTSEAKKARQKEFEFTVRQIMPLDRMENDWSQDQKGVLVVEVVAGGAASLAGLSVEDLILAINGEAVRDTDEFEKVMKRISEKKPKVIEVFVRRDELTSFVFIEPEWDKAADSE